MVALKSDDNRPLGSIEGYMTRAKAIEILSEANRTDFSWIDQDFRNALKLAIQDMWKVEQAHRAASERRDDSQPGR
jgi:hypothetical protein